MLSFRDPAAMEALQAFADLTEDDDLAVAIVMRLDAIADEYVQSNEAAERINEQITGHSAEALVQKHLCTAIDGARMQGSQHYAGRAND